MSTTYYTTIEVWPQIRANRQCVSCHHAIIATVVLLLPRGIQTPYHRGGLCHIKDEVRAVLDPGV